MNPAYFVFFFAWGAPAGPPPAITATNRFVRGLLVAPGKLVK